MFLQLWTQKSFQFLSLPFAVSNFAKFGPDQNTGYCLLGIQSDKAIIREGEIVCVLGRPFQLFRLPFPGK